MQLAAAAVSDNGVQATLSFSVADMTPTGAPAPEPTFTAEELAHLPRPAAIGCFGGYLYLNMSLTRLYGVRCPGLTPEIVDMQYFGEMAMAELVSPAA